MNKKYVIKYSLLGVILLTCIVFVIFGNQQFSGTNARYVTSVSSSDDVAVAKWDIQQLNDAGTIGQLQVNNFRLRQSGVSGSFLFQIANFSLVAAKISERSTIRIRLDSENFSSVDVEQQWNFIKNSESGTYDNPISFDISMYRNKLENIITYGKLENILSISDYDALVEQTEKDKYVLYETGIFYVLAENIITKTEYDALSEPQKANYIKYLGDKYIKVTKKITFDEYLQLTEIEKKEYVKEVNDDVAYTHLSSINSTNNIKLSAGQEEKDGKLIKYFFVDLNFKDNITIPDAYFGIGDNQYVTFRIDWKVSEVSSSGGSDIENKYHSYKLVEIPEGYQVEETEHNLFDYYNYLSSIPGPYIEPSFVIDDNNIIYSKLTEAQKTIIKSYSSIKSPSTLDEYQKYVEYQTFINYELFLSDYSAYLNSLNYLQFGLNCSFAFTIIVEQVD